LAKLNEEEFKKHIKTGEYYPAYLIYGDENYLKSVYVSKLKESIVNPTFESFNYHYYENGEVSLDEVIKDAQMLPMMSDYNLTVVKDYPIEKNKSDVKAICDYLDDAVDTTVFVLWFEAVEPDIKGSKFNSLIKAFDKVGASVNIEYRSESDIAKLLVNGAKKRGATLDSVNARHLIDVSGNDLKTLMNELDKLAYYVDGGEITKDIIDSMATKCLQARVYDLSKYIVSGNTDMAYSVLDTFFTLKEEPVSLLAVIGSVYVDMYRVKCAKTAGFAYDEVAKHYDYRRKEFRLKNASRECSKLSEQQLRQSLDEICAVDLKLKSTAADKRLLLEELMLKLVMIARGELYA
jgi:DNA polymerase-3 subunit delta